jgi:hypothetical protein
LSRLLGAALSCPQPEPLADVLAVLDAAAATPFTALGSTAAGQFLITGKDEVESGGAAHPARVCLAVLCGSGADASDEKTGGPGAAGRLVRRLEKVGHNGCWVSCMSALAHLARQRLKGGSAAGPIQSGDIEGSGLDARAADGLLGDLVFGGSGSGDGGASDAATFDAAGAEGSSSSSSMRIGAAGRAQLTRPDCPVATVAAAKLFASLAAFGSRYARQLMRDGVAEFAIAGLGHSSRK